MMNSNGNAALAEALADAEHTAPEAPQPHTLVPFSPDWFAIQIITAEAAANQQMTAFMATEAFQLWQQRIGELNGLRKLAALAASPPT